ncbi:S24 family peptidase [Pseudomonas fulva]|uniref:S24 family peptidase n=1 Tax=Pseudomonas fulva TaxID=47880 RepID=UPI00191DF11E|nr:helix-turn-helix transcriptional regulator [Pseudomonas fulva]MBN4165063.1 helix-turn-helix transcriptional regulator [Pseudomonas fulva]
MDIYEIRKANLIRLIGGQKKAACAERWEMSPAHLSQILSDKTSKNLGDDVARRIEGLQGLPHGWLDSLQAVDYGEETISIEGLPAPLAQKISSYRPVVQVPRYDVAGSMGPGSEPPDINMVVEHMSLDANWVRQNLTYTKLENLKLISGRGDSMAPTIRSGDAVLVDAGVTTVEDDAIYFFLMRGKLQIKRIQRGLDGLTIISDNGQYPPIEVPGDREADITVLAQIIYWWTGRSF